MLELLYKTRALKIKYKLENKLFDVLDCDDADYKAMLYMAGRSMRNMLEYIKQNYKSHFSGITIDSITRMVIDLNE